ncbi:ATP-dependent helicase [Bacillus shivajii]|uniref:ATP-dependent helicase n=1 Tax=Bacillus shivajii TaxID=1983719 RepID=UPI001CFB2DE7|nr:ATP-dependent helicase [Bacillus shivajii]UCZ51933.1 ATP-dependent helicase [Bacillus shivajii]
MNRAMINGHTYDLSSLQRGELTKVFHLTKKHEATCTICHKQVQLHLFIKQPPMFSHIDESEDCKESAPSVKVSTQTTEKSEPGGMITLPKSKSIQNRSVETVGISNWKPPICLDPKVAWKEEKHESFTFQEKMFSHDQLQAVKSINGPHLIIAGAGSGKTRVLTARTAYMISENLVSPKQIMLVTFTQKAAQEMKRRLATEFSLPQEAVQSIVMGTFHSLFYRMLMHHQPDRWRQDQLLSKKWQQERIFQQLLIHMKLDEKDVAMDVHMVRISAWKNELLFPDQIEPADAEEEETLTFYKAYEDYKKRENLFDFDDMLIGCYQMLKENPDLLQLYQNRFKHFMIDEFQDINLVQYEIMKMMALPENQLCVVGDDDQSIYRFRGSHPKYILNFQEEFPHAKKIVLANNYRSTYEIVDAANKVIQKNSDRHVKEMYALASSEEKPTVIFPYDEEEEAFYIIEDIKKKYVHGENDDDFAILYRTHVQSRALFELLLEEDIPFTIDKGSDVFYERSIVKHTLAFFHIAENENDTEAMEKLLRVWFLKKTALRELERLTILEDKSLLQCVTSLEGLPAFQSRKLKRILPMFKRLRKMPLEDAMQQIYEEMGMKEYIRKNGKEGNGYDKGSDDWAELITLTKKHRDILSFLEHIKFVSRAHREKKAEKDRYGVQLMSIHQSKGLEFPYVYVIGCNDGTLPHEYALDCLRDGDKQFFEEERRLLYVAMTRAIETLTLSVTDFRRGKRASPSRFLKVFPEIKKEL